MGTNLMSILNMFNSPMTGVNDSKKSASEKTRKVILEKALALFRGSGFEVTTMRDIAQAADVATGAAYYYFPSKEAMVSAYYDQVLRIHAEKVREQLQGKEGLRERLGVVLHSKLEILKDDRKFLGALFRFTGEPSHPLSVFGNGTHAQRTQSVAILREAIEGTGVSEEQAQLLPWVLWLLQLAMVLFLIYDESEGQQKAHKLSDGILDLLSQLVQLTNSAVARPFVQPVQARMLGMLREAGLTGE
jgi:AcrR family transcriptional regulator